MKKLIAILLICLMALSMIPMMSSAAEKTVENIAAGKTVVTGTGADGTCVTDGKTDGYVDISWSDNDGVAQDNCWVYVDLGTATVVKGVGVANYPQGSYYQWEAFGSNDAETWTKLCEKKDETPSNGIVYNYDVTDTTAYRYVKVAGTFHSGNIGYHFNEVRVYAETENSVEFGKVLGEGALSDGAAYWQVVVADKFGGATLNVFSDAETAPTLENYETKDLAPWYQFNSQITAANFYGVANVPKVALKGYQNVTRIQVGEGVTTIGGDAFAEIPTHPTIYLPGSVTTFEQGTTYATAPVACYVSCTAAEWEARWGTAQVWGTPYTKTVDGVVYTMERYQNGYWSPQLVGETTPDFTGCPTIIPGHEVETGDATVVLAVLAVVALVGTAVIVRKVHD